MKTVAVKDSDEAARGAYCAALRKAGLRVIELEGGSVFDVAAQLYAARALRAHGYLVLEIDPTSVFDVLRALRREGPDLVILDYGMPQCSPLTLLRGIREDPCLRDLPVLVYTAHQEPETIQDIQRFGISGYMPKPLSPEDFQLWVKGFLQWYEP